MKYQFVLIISCLILATSCTDKKPLAAESSSSESLSPSAQVKKADSTKSLNSKSTPSKNQEVLSYQKLNDQLITLEKELLNFDYSKNVDYILGEEDLKAQIDLINKNLSASNSISDYLSILAADDITGSLQVEHMLYPDLLVDQDSLDSFFSGKPNGTKEFLLSLADYYVEISKKLILKMRISAKTLLDISKDLSVNQLNEAILRAGLKGSFPLNYSAEDEYRATIDEIEEIERISIDSFDSFRKIINKRL